MVRPEASLAGHFFRPGNVGRVEPPCSVGRAGNAACGDELELSLRVDGGRVTQARFLASGCSALIATASLLTQELQGLGVAAARGLDLERLVSAAGGLEPRGRHALWVAARALAAALGAEGNARKT
jgi:NifU-like protein involved in Fe-S cluster formation